MLITKKTWEVVSLDVQMNQCGSGESIHATSFGQHDRQTNFDGIFYIVYFWSLESFSCIKKYPKMEKTGKCYYYNLKLIQIYTFYLYNN